MESAANDFFERILPDKDNFEVFDEACDIEELRKEVVARLEKIEKEDLFQFWWDDRALIGLFQAAFTSGCILLPPDSVERLRWVALLCVEMSNIEDFDCGNIVIPFDFLPVDIMVLFEDLYGEDVIEAVMTIREKLTDQGWDKVFGY